LRTPRLSDTIARMLEDAGAETWVACPGRVESYDATARTATVSPCLKRVIRNAEGDREAFVMPPIPAVPVCWPGQIDLVKGDGVLLIFCDYDIGAWRDSGKTSDAGDETAHGPSGAVCLPGLDTVTRKTAEVSQYAALANLVQAQLSALKTAIQNTVIVPNDGGASFKETLLSGLSSWPASVASSKVRVLQ
jgi:hypothetical protein